MRTWFLALAAGLTFHPAAQAQMAAWQFRSSPGQVLCYRVEHVTSATELVGGSKNSVITKLNLVKRWRDLGPEKGKAGTRYALSLASLRLETTRANGEVLWFDSADPKKSTPELRPQLSKLVGPVLAVLRVDATGNVLEIIESKHGPASRFDSELPFVVLLPGGTPRVGQTWERAYRVTLAPPQGTGEKYDAAQKFECKQVRDGMATIALTTVFPKLPESPLDQVPLLQVQPQGVAVFDIAAGRLHSARLRIDKELSDYQGKGSSYRFQSEYSEQYVGGK
jgi:hypothetical protein